MPAPATIDDFLAVIRKSKQVDTTRLCAYLAQKQQSEALPADPRKLAAQLVREGLLTLFQAEQFLMGKHRGFVLGSYRVIERLGAGGAGTVYLAEHESLGRRVALKVLPTVCAEDPAMLERFRREAKAAALLNHPNVVQLHDFRKEGALHYLVLEYIDGPNLHQVVARQGPLPIPVACEYARQACLGLHHAHEKGLVHRDVKPANLLIDQTGTIKVLDLGLARMEERDEDCVTRKFNNQSVLGTADFLAPEQALSLHDADRRADIYSMGCTLYALLVGHPPFNTGTVPQKLMWHQMREPDCVRTLRPEVPTGLAALVARMMAKQPVDRPQTMLEVVTALEPWAGLAPRPELAAGGSVIEFRHGNKTRSLLAPTGKQLVSGKTGQPMPRAEVDTWTSKKDATGALEQLRNTPPLALPVSRPTKRSWWPIVFGAVAILAAIAAGVVLL